MANVITNVEDEIKQDKNIKDPNRGRPKKYKMVRVHRSNIDPDNRDNIISVCVNSPENRKKFYPGEEVKLTEEQINVLKTSVEETRLVIPPDSGIYQSKNPMVTAKNSYPNMIPEQDRATGLITMTSRTPNYIVEILD